MAYNISKPFNNLTIKPHNNTHMRIIHFTNNYLPRISGPARAVYNYKTGLEARGHQVLVISPRYFWTDNSDTNGNLKVPSVRLGKFFGSLNNPIPLPLKGLYRALFEQFKPHILHVHQPFMMGSTAQQLHDEYKIPLVFTLHTPYHLYYEHLKAGIISSLLSKRLRSVITDYCEKSDAIIVPSNKMARLIRSTYAKTHVIPTPIDTQHFAHADSTFLRTRYNIPPHYRILLTVSRLSYEKNGLMLLRAYAMLRKKYPHTHLFIVGSGYLEPILKVRALSLGLNGSITFCGKVQYDLLKNFYASADVFVYATLFDSQSLVVSEALVSGLPVLIYDGFGALKFFIKDGYNGFWTNTATHFQEKLQRLVADDALRATMRTNQLANAHHFSINETTKKLEQIYHLLHEKRRTKTAFR